MSEELRMGGLSTQGFHAQRKRVVFNQFFVGPVLRIDVLEIA